MTDVLDRTTLDELQLGRVATTEAPHRARPALAALSASAAVIHLVMVPSHWGESSWEGAAFVAAGWTQLLLAALLLGRPSRRLLLLTAAVNAGFIGIWAYNRLTTANDVDVVDLSAVALEAALVMGCLLGLRRVVSRRWGTAAVTVATSLAALALATAAVASPSARDHADHGAGADTQAVHTHGGDAPAAAAAPVDDRGLSALSNGHHHEMGPEQPLDRATRAELSRQIALTQQVAAQYPTVAAAEGAGYRRAGPYSPGLGAHYIRASGAGLNADGVVDDADALSPLAIIYEGTDPEARVAGFMYYSMAAAEPEGFAGPNDVWHYHTNTCLKPTANGELDAPFGADREVSAELCQQAGGYLLEQTQWMVHVWSVPGWESQQGLFGEVNPALACPDGSYHQRPIEEWIDHPLNTCLSAPGG